MTSRILNRFNIKTGRLLRSIATDKLSCDIHPRKMIKMVRRVSRDHIIILFIFSFSFNLFDINMNFSYMVTLSTASCVFFLSYLNIQMKRRMSLVICI